MDFKKLSPNAAGQQAKKIETVVTNRYLFAHKI